MLRREARTLRRSTPQEKPTHPAQKTATDPHCSDPSGPANACRPAVAVSGHTQSESMLRVLEWCRSQHQCSGLRSGLSNFQPGTHTTSDTGPRLSANCSTLTSIFCTIVSSRFVIMAAAEKPVWFEDIAHGEAIREQKGRNQTVSRVALIQEYATFSIFLPATHAAEVCESPLAVATPSTVKFARPPHPFGPPVFQHSSIPPFPLLPA